MLYCNPTSIYYNKEMDEMKHVFFMGLNLTVWTILVILNRGTFRVAELVIGYRYMSWYTRMKKLNAKCGEQPLLQLWIQLPYQLWWIPSPQPHNSPPCRVAVMVACHWRHSIFWALVYHHTDDWLSNIKQYPMEDMNKLSLCSILLFSTQFWFFG